MLFLAGLWGENNPHDLSFYRSLKYSDAYLIQVLHTGHWHFGSNNLFLYLDTSFESSTRGAQRRGNLHLTIKNICANL